MYHVVIVDDEPIIVEGISKLVPWEKYGCRVGACAYNGKEGLETIRENSPDIVFTDIRTEKYANIMFTGEIYSARRIIHDFLDSLDIIYAGRFGEWDYLWTGQSIISGKKAAEKIKF